MKIADAILPALTAAVANATTIREATHLRLPPLSQAAYATADTVLMACDFRWKRGAKAHIGDAAALARLMAALECGQYIDVKRDREFYATPADLCASIAEAIAEDLLWDAPRILEPGAGEGALVDAVLEAIPNAAVTAVEKDAMAAAFLRRKYADEPRVRVVEGDFETLDLGPVPFHAVAMNPPFSRARQHAMRAFALLEKSGVLAAVLPQEAQDERRPLGDWCAEREADIEPVPAGAFKASGTTVATTLVTIHKTPTLGERLREALGVPMGKHRLVDRLEHLSHQVLASSCRGCSVPLSSAEIEEMERNRREAAEIARLLGAKLVASGDVRSGHGFGLKVPSGVSTGWSGHLIVPARYRPKATPFRIEALAVESGGQHLAEAVAEALEDEDAVVVEVAHLVTTTPAQDKRGQYLLAV